VVSSASFRLRRCARTDSVFFALDVSIKAGTGYRVLVPAHLVSTIGLITLQRDKNTMLEPQQYTVVATADGSRYKRAVVMSHEEAGFCRQGTGFIIWPHGIDSPPASLFLAPQDDWIHNDLFTVIPLSGVTCTT